MAPHPLLHALKALFDLRNGQPNMRASEFRDIGARLQSLASAIFELEAWQRDPVGLDDQVLRDLISRVGMMFGESIENPAVLEVACDAAATLVRVAATAGFDHEPIVKYFKELLDHAAVVSESHAAVAGASRFVLLEGIYDARTVSVDHDVLIDATDRYRYADKMLAFISSELDVAAQERVNALEHRVDTVARAEVDRISIAQEHRRLSWEASLAVERYGVLSDN